MDPIVVSTGVVPDEDQLINARAACAMLGNITLMSLWRRRKSDPDFPPTIQLAGRNHFRLGQMRRYIAKHEVKREP